MKIVRRIGVPPRERGSAQGRPAPTSSSSATANFAVIGTEATAALDGELPPDAARADYERIVDREPRDPDPRQGDIPDA